MPRYSYRVRPSNLSTTIRSGVQQPAEPVVEPEPEPEKLTGKALDDRGAELNIEGFSSMKADEKRSAIAEAESA